jgi:hypothetical protein
MINHFRQKQISPTGAGLMLNYHPSAKMLFCEFDFTKINPFSLHNMHILFNKATPDRVFHGEYHFPHARLQPHPEMPVITKCFH